MPSGASTRTLSEIAEPTTSTPRLTTGGDVIWNSPEATNATPGLESRTFVLALQSGLRSRSAAKHKAAVWDHLKRREQPETSRDRSEVVEASYMEVRHALTLEATSRQEWIGARTNVVDARSARPI